MKILNEQDILDDPAVSFWLKEQIRASKNRDIVDVINDVELLLRILNERFEASHDHVTIS